MTHDTDPPDPPDAPIPFTLTPRGHAAVLGDRRRALIAEFDDLARSPHVTWQAWAAMAKRLRDELVGP